MLKKKVFSSWDRFIVPYPFSRGVFLWGDPIRVDRDADAVTLERIRLELETALSSLSSEAEAMCYDSGESPAVAPTDAGRDDS